MEMRVCVRWQGLFVVDLSACLFLYWFLWMTQLTKVSVFSSHWRWWRETLTRASDWSVVLRIDSTRSRRKTLVEQPIQKIDVHRCTWRIVLLLGWEFESIRSRNNRISTEDSRFTHSISFTSWMSNERCVYGSFSVNPTSLLFFLCHSTRERLVHCSDEWQVGRALIRLSSCSTKSEKNTRHWSSF